MIKHNYYWDSVGDQDKCIHKTCSLGPYKLEVKEENWNDDEIELRPRILLWNQEEFLYEEHKVFPLVPGTTTSAGLPLIEWYELNVLGDKILLGDS